MRITYLDCFINIAFTICILIVILVPVAYIYDATKLTPVSYQGILIDKWHEDGDCDYINNSVICGGDKYGIVIKTDNEQIIEGNISQTDWKQILLNSRVNYSFDLGRIGMRHNEHLSKASD